MKQCYTTAEIREVVKAVQRGMHLVAACRMLGFCCSSVSAQISRLGLSSILQQEKRQARLREPVGTLAALHEERLRLGVEIETAMPWERAKLQDRIETIDFDVARLSARKPPKPPKPPKSTETKRTVKKRTLCCTCKKPLKPGATWAYCSKDCERNRKSTQGHFPLPLTESGAAPPSAPACPQGTESAPDQGADEGRKGAEGRNRPNLPGRQGTAGTATLRASYAIDIATERLIDLRGAIKWMEDRGARRPHLNGLMRWIRSPGVRGCVLPTVLVGGLRYTTEGALLWWIAATNLANSPTGKAGVVVTALLPGGAAGRDGGLDAGGVRLDSLGLQPRDDRQDRPLVGAGALPLAHAQHGPRPDAGDVCAPSREPVGRDDRLQQVVQGLGFSARHGEPCISIAKKSEGSLDCVANIGDKGPKNSPDCRPTFDGRTAAEARTEPRKESDTMSTLSHVPTPLQQLEAACAGAPLHDPRTDELIRERRAAYEAEQARDLAGLTREQLAASVRRIFFQQDGEHVSANFGIDLLVGDEGEIVNAAVGSVAEFLEHWGTPVTHARAEQIADEVRERGYRDALREDLERAVERASELAAERAYETWSMGNN